MCHIRLSRWSVTHSGWRTRLHPVDRGGELLSTAEPLVVALATIIDAARRAGGRFVVVDAIDDNAADFYAHYEFEAIPDNPHRLIRKLSTIARALGQPRP